MTPNSRAISPIVISPAALPLSSPEVTERLLAESAAFPNAEVALMANPFRQRPKVAGTSRRRQSADRDKYDPFVEECHY